MSSRPRVCSLSNRVGFLWYFSAIPNMPALPVDLSSPLTLPLALVLGTSDVSAFLWELGTHIHGRSGYTKGLGHTSIQNDRCLTNLYYNKSVRVLYLRRQDDLG